MANSILHDFKSPVTSIGLAVGAIGKRHRDPATSQASAVILRQLRRMESMVEEVLEFARGESRLERRPVAVRGLFASLLELNADAVHRSGVTVRVRTPDLTVALDHDRMLRVLQNLLSNAIDALGSRPGGRILLTARRRGAACEIAVHDNGPGVPRAIWGTLFQPFTTHGKSGGTGLGLAIARNIVEAHGGKIAFESARGAGTTFRLRLPLRA
jgi:signal transduction histidine kinase